MTFYQLATSPSPITTSAHLGSLGTGLGLGTILRSSDIVRFVLGGVVKTSRCTPQTSVIKNREYYLSLDLGCVPKHVKHSPSVRATDELWGDLLTAIWYRSQSSTVPTDVLVDAVGNPDAVTSLSSGDEAWVYDWLGKHGPNTYSSATPFQVRDGAVVGIDDHDGKS